MLESAVESYLVDAHALVCLKQMTGAFHLYLQHERAGRAARDGHYLAVELARTHAQLVGQGVYVELLFVEQQVDVIHRLGQEAAFGIGQFHLRGLLVGGVGIVAVLTAECTLAVEQPFHHRAQLIHVEWLGQIGVGTRFDTFDALLLRYLCRDDDDGDVVDHVVGPHASAQLQTVHARHHQVGDDEVGHQVDGLLQSVLSVGGISYAVAVGQQIADI